MKMELTRNNWPANDHSINRRMNVERRASIRKNFNEAKFFQNLFSESLDRDRSSRAMNSQRLDQYFL